MEKKNQTTGGEKTQTTAKTGMEPDSAQTTAKTAKKPTAKKATAKPKTAKKPVKKAVKIFVPCAKTRTAEFAGDDYLTKIELHKEKGESEKPQSNKVAVIVGASSGIGYHTALLLEQENYTVYNISRTKPDTKSIRSLKADACKEGELAAAIETVLNAENKIDAFIYSAGWSLACPFEYISAADYKKIFDINYFGLIECLKVVVPFMRKQQSGRIIAVSSLAGSTPLPFDAPYSASKAAVDSTLKSLAIELYPYSVKVLSVAPGGVATHFTFKRKVYPCEKVGSYASALNKATKKLNAIEQKGLDPEVVATEITHLVKAKNPPLNSTVGLKNKAAKVMERFLPTVLTDYMNRMAWE